MGIKITNEMIVKNINLSDLLKINHLFFKNQNDYSKERFLLEIKKELEIADVKDIIYSSSFIQSIILHYEDVNAFSMFADPENLYSEKELDILIKSNCLIKTKISDDSYFDIFKYTFSIDFLEFMNSCSTINNGEDSLKTPYFYDFNKIQAFIYNSYFDSF